MGFLKKVAGAIISPLGAALGLFGGGKARPKMLPGPVTRDEAREEADRDRELRMRRGAASDMLTGTQGAEAAASSIGRIVTGS